MIVYPFRILDPGPYTQNMIAHDAAGIEALIRLVYAADIAALTDGQSFIHTAAIKNTAGTPVYEATNTSVMVDSILFASWNWGQLAAQIALCNTGGNPPNELKLTRNYPPIPETGWLRTTS